MTTKDKTLEQHPLTLEAKRLVGLLVHNHDPITSFALLDGPKGRMLVDMSMIGTGYKDAAMAALRHGVAIYQATACALVTEAWAVSESGDRGVDAQPPSQRDDRYEVVWAVIETRDGQRGMISARISRNHEGRSLEAWEFMKGTEGRMTGFFEQDQTP
jgi:hypothetical protein